MTEPYYSDEYVTLYHGNNLDVLPSLSGIGAVLTSPPYNLRSEGHIGSGSKWSELRDGYASHGDDMPHVAYLAWQRRVIDLCWQALADDGVIFYNHKQLLSREPGRAVRLPFELVPEGIPLRQVITWDRGSGMTRTHCHYVPRFEWVLVLAREPFRTNTLVLDDVWTIPFETGGEHPAPFPLKLATMAIGSTSAGLVLDPHAGSGTTLVAAKSLGRRAIGIELDERYCEIAAKRLAQGVLDFGAVS